jgi:hypothetical protein
VNDATARSGPQSAPVRWEELPAALAAQQGKKVSGTY